MFPHSDACERNKEPILAVLRQAFAGCRQALEIGSGTGQHAVYFAAGMPWLGWQPTELADSVAALERRVLAEGPPNLRRPLALDVTAPSWEVPPADAVFTANTLHILHWREVEALFAHLPAIAPAGAVLAVYGPFRYDGLYTSPSNESFDRYLRARDPGSGIRDFEAVDALARDAGFRFVADHPMPANNQTLIWKSTAGPEIRSRASAP